MSLNNYEELFKDFMSENFFHLPFSKELEIKSELIEEKFICNYINCDKRFNSKSNVKRHIMSAHLNIRYTCIYCYKKYINKHDLKHHINVIHNNFRYECEKCNIKYLQKSSLNKHLKKCN